MIRALEGDPLPDAVLTGLFDALGVVVGHDRIGVHFGFLPEPRLPPWLFVFLEHATRPRGFLVPSLVNGHEARIACPQTLSRPSSR